jgi:uroporphyrinogen-III synthase
MSCSWSLAIEKISTSTFPASNDIYLKNMATPTVISTWPLRENDRFAHILRNNGISVLQLPMIEIHYLPFSLKQKIEEYDWIIFTSKNGVESFLNSFNFDVKNKIAVIGKGTAAPLDENKIAPTFIGHGRSGKDFGRELKAVIGENNNILLALGNLAPDVLTGMLSPKNHVDRVDVYETRMPGNIDRYLLSLIVRNSYDVIAVSSPSGIKNLHQYVFKELKEPLRMVSIGEATTAAARDLGIEPLATANEQSYEGLAKCVLDIWEKR